MKTLVLSLAIKDDAVYNDVIKMLNSNLKEMGINIFQQAGPGVTILNGVYDQMLADKEETEKEEEEKEEAEEEPKSDEEAAETSSETEIESPESSEDEDEDEDEESEVDTAEVEPEEMTVATEEISQKEYINGVRSFYLGNDELVAEKGVDESMLFVDEIVIDGPYALFKFNNTFYRYPIYESNSEGTFIKLDFYTSEMTFKEVKCLLKTNEGQYFNLILGAGHEK